MILRIDTRGASLDAPDDLGALSAVIAPDADVQSWAQVVGDDHLAVDPDLLVRLAAPHSDGSDWTARFADMLDFARVKGWVDGNGRIRVHVEHEGRPPATVAVRRTRE